MKFPNLRYSKEFIFLAMAILLLLILIVFISWNLSFVVSRLNIVLDTESLRSSETTRFNLEEFEKLGLTERKK